MITKMINNQMIRAAQNRHGLRQWQVADIIGIHADTLSRKLRHELPEEEQKAIVKQIEEAMQE